MSQCRCILAWVLTTRTLALHTGLAAKDKMLVPGGGKFGGASTMHTDFPPKQGARSKGHGPIGEPFPYRPFDDRTTYNTYHNGKVREGHALVLHPVLHPVH